MSSDLNHRGLLKKTRPFSQEILSLSYWHSFSTLLLFVSSLLCSFFLNILLLKLVVAILSGLILARCFILFHDFQHKAILRDSKLAPYLFGALGLYLFTPPKVWRKSHNFHHAHNTILDNSFIGSFWTVSVSQWQSMTNLERLKYKIVRNPLLIIFGVLTVFIYDHCIKSFLRMPRKNWTALLSLGLHASILVIASIHSEWLNYFVVVVIPLFVAGCLGTYLFYAQHNFPAVKLQQRKEWSLVDAALYGSSFIRMPKLMHWFTGNIAYHHVHHLNHRIPFYRLPEAMREIKELQNPITTSLNFQDIWACLRLKLWDENKQHMVAMNDLALSNISDTNR